MKDFVNKNAKLIIMSITIITVTTIVCSAAFSYAAGNATTNVYTRDELSEKVGNLEESQKSFLQVLHLLQL